MVETVFVIRSNGERIQADPRGLPADALALLRAVGKIFYNGKYYGIKFN